MTVLKSDGHVPRPAGDVNGLSTPRPGMKFAGIKARVCTDRDQAIRAYDLRRRRLVLSATAALAALAFTAAPFSDIVGGGDAAAGEFPSVAEITFGAFGCTGTLISPDTVLSAGHCGSLTGAAVASPAVYPPQLIDVMIGSYHSGDGETSR